MVIRGAALLAVTVMLLGSSAAASSPGSASASGRWTPLNIPGHEIADDYAVSCLSASSCYLAGAVGNTGFMRFDGHRLHPMPSPPFGPQSNSDLEDLACASAQFCMTVGDRAGVPATADRWNGRRWSVTPVPVQLPARFRHGKIAVSGLASVACSSSSMCLAVGGWYGFASHQLAGVGRFAVRWDGARWTPIKGPRSHAVLLSVACASTTDCVVVGARLRPHSLRVASPISLRWHDGRWSQLTVRTPSGVSQVGLDSVSCPVVGSCVAVGSAVRPVRSDGKQRRLQRALVLHQRGDSWIARTLPEARSISNLAKRPATQSLTDVSCPLGAASACVAVGTWGTAGSGLNLSAGGFAAPLSPARMQPLSDPTPSSISCPTVEFCLAGGNESIERFHRDFNGSFFGG